MRRAVILSDLAATEHLGGELAQALPENVAGWIMLLQGELGSGKSTLARAMLRELGHMGTVPSPTYTLIEPYKLSSLSIYHIDLYRLSDAHELEDLGLRDLLEDQALLLVEWPERGSGVLPAADLLISIEHRDVGRRVTLEAATAAGQHLVSKLQPA